MTLKAYEVDCDDNEYMSKIVWAETAGKAKASMTYAEELGEPEYLEITARRLPWADSWYDKAHVPGKYGYNKEFMYAWMHHGLEFFVDEDRVAMITEKTIPLIQKVGGFNNAFEATEEIEISTEKVKVPAWFDEWYRDFDMDQLNAIYYILDGQTDVEKINNANVAMVLNFINAILNGYEVEQEPMYRIPLPNLRTSDGYQQYLSRRNKQNGKWFASRRQSNLIQTFTKAELGQVPEAYRQYAEGIEADENN